jgi:hypothetical protein
MLLPHSKMMGRQMVRMDDGDMQSIRRIDKRGGEASGGAKRTMSLHTTIARCW